MHSKGIDVEAIGIEELDAARGFLEYDLRDSADEQSERAAAYEEDDSELSLLKSAIANRLEELADAVADLSPEVLAEYAMARRIEEERGGDLVHCSMTMEIGGALNPQNIEDLCRIYGCAVECIRHSRFAKEGHMADFWVEFATTART